MNKEQQIMKLQAVINTLSATTIRADQVDAVQRINACTAELSNMIKVMQAQDEKAAEAE